MSWMSHVACLGLATTLVLAGCAGSPSSAPESEAVQQEQTQEPADASLGQKEFSQALVSYLGPEGTYTQEACAVFFDGEGTYLPQKDVAASVRAMLDGETDYAVIPQENAIGGPIAEYMDEVVGAEGLCVVGEVELPISQNLLAQPQTQLEDVKTVYSHKQGIAQGKEWLAEHLSDAEVMEVSSTAEGARMVAESSENNCAAIGAAAAARVYGLEVLADNIQMNDANKTRFYVLAKGTPSEEASDRMAFLASGNVEDLAELLTSIEAQGMEVVAVHDRPRKTQLGDYTYLIECAGGGRAALDEVVKNNDGFEYRYLGSFPVK